MNIIQILSRPSCVHEYYPDSLPSFLCPDIPPRHITFLPSVAILKAKRVVSVSTEQNRSRE